MLFGGAAARPSLPHVIGYTFFHYAAFAAVGLAAAHFTGVAERQGAFTALFFILFVAFEVGSSGMIAVLDATGILAALTWFQIGIGNLLATSSWAAISGDATPPWECGWKRHSAAERGVLLGVLGALARTLCRSGRLAQSRSTTASCNASAQRRRCSAGNGSWRWLRSA